MATAAMAFIGWTGKGTPNAMPVAIFAMPENTRVVEREMDPVRVSAMSRGSRVPKSPRDPDNSAKGLLRMVLRLYSLMRRQSVLSWSFIMLQTRMSTTAMGLMQDLNAEDVAEIVGNGNA